MKYILLIILPIIINADETPIKNLGNSRWTIREETTKKLYDSGVIYYKDVLNNIDNTDLEIRWRCRFLAIAMVDKIPIRFFCDNPKYWNYKIINFITNNSNKKFDENAETVDFIAKNTASDVYGPMVVELYKKSNTICRNKYMQYIGTAAMANDRLPNEYLDIIINHFNQAGYDELDVILALSKIKNEVVFKLLLDKLLYFGENDHALFVTCDNGWLCKYSIYKETLLSVLRSFPSEYKERHKKDLAKYDKIASRPIVSIVSIMNKIVEQNQSKK